MTGYMICATPRSGSTLLCALLRASGVAGWPESWFRAADRADWAVEWRAAPGFGGYLAAARVAGRHAGSVFGLRMMGENLGDLLGDLAVMIPLPTGDRQRLSDALGVTQYIHLYRRNLVAQAVSRLRAEVSGIWHPGIEEAAQPVQPSYDFAAIRGFVGAARAENAGWERWFSTQGITPLKVDYEDLAADPAGVAGRVLDHLGLTAAHRLTAPNRRMADATSALWAARFRAEAGLAPG